LQRKLDNDPDYKARMLELERARQARRAELDAEQAPILAEIAELGVSAPHMFVLFNLPERNPKITKLLLPKLNEKFSEATLDCCLRVMIAAGPCPGAIDQIYDFLRRKLDEVSYTPGKENPSELLIGTSDGAILDLATKEDLPLVEKLIADERLREYQKMIRSSIKKIVSPPKKAVAAPRRKVKPRESFWKRMFPWL
jgi:hypothetical protein